MVHENNMKLLKSVIVLVKQPPPKEFFLIYKAIEEIRHLNSENLTGILS
jgi:hypothetical protein